MSSIKWCLVCWFAVLDSFITLTGSHTTDRLVLKDGMLWWSDQEKGRVAA